MLPIIQYTGRLGNQMFEFSYIYSQMKKGLIPDVFVQSEEFFEESKEEIKKLFQQAVPEKTYKVAIHVRRGDYVRNPYYVDLTQTDYYEKAIAEFPKTKFLVFSDDIEFCKEYFIGKEYEFCEETDPVISMNIIASCIGHIIANSSFSWWGAYISPYSEKVVAPLAWYGDEVERTKLPSEWIKL